MSTSHPENRTSKEFQMLTRLSDQIEPGSNSIGYELPAMGFSLDTPNRTIESLIVGLNKDGGRLVAAEVLVLSSTGNALTPNLLVMPKRTFELKSGRTSEAPNPAVLTLQRALRNALMIINSKNN